MDWFLYDKDLRHKSQSHETEYNPQTASKLVKNVLKFTEYYNKFDFFEFIVRDFGHCFSSDRRSFRIFSKI